MTGARQVGLDILPDYSNALVTEPAASGSAHGGRLTELILAEVRQIGEKRNPRSVSLQFLRPTFCHNVIATYRVLRIARPSTLVGVDVTQDDVLTVTGHVNLADAGEPPLRDETMPVVGPPDDYPPMTLPPEFRPRFTEHVDYRLVDVPPIFGGAEHVEATVWLRRHDLDATAGALGFFCDCMVATPLMSVRAPAHAMTTDYHLYWCGDMDATPFDDWVLARFVLRNSQGRWACEDGTLWAADGRLLGFSRQVRRVSKPV